MEFSSLPNSVVRLVEYVAAGGGEFIIVLIFGLFAFFTLRYLFCSAFFRATAADHRQAARDLRSGALLVGALLFGLSVVGFAVYTINTTQSEERIIVASVSVMELDHAIFGVYPPLWLHRADNPFYHLLARNAGMIAGSYGQLGILLSAALLLFLFFRPDLFLRMSLALVLTAALGVPFWISIPALTPHEAFIANKPAMEIPEPIREELRMFAPPAEIGDILEWIAAYRRSGSGGYWGVTTIPSMHIAWATLLLCYGILLWRPLALFLVPYFIVNAFSTVYLAQHYAVDVIAGILTAAIGIFILRRFPPAIPAELADTSAALHRDASAALALLCPVRKYL